MERLRMGIIGLGMAFERLHYPAYQKLCDRFEIAAICDLDERKVRAWQSTLGLDDGDLYTDFREMVSRDDIHAVDILVPIELNFHVTQEVAAFGKPIICEKPLAPTKEQARAARRLPEQYGIPILIAENYRYNDEINSIRDLVQTRDIGDVYYFMQNRVADIPSEMLKNKFPAKEWRQHPEFPGGIFYDTGVHDIAALQHIFGAIERVHAFGVKQEEDYAPYAVVQANLQFQNSVTGQFTFFSSGKEMQRPLVGLRIFGTDGMIFLEERDCGIINVSYNDGNRKEIPYQPQMGFYHELQNFYQAVTGEEPVSVTPELEYGDAMVMFAMLDSIEQQQSIAVAEMEQYEPEPVPV